MNKLLIVDDNQELTGLLTSAVLAAPSWAARPTMSEGEPAVSGGADSQMMEGQELAGNAAGDVGSANALANPLPRVDKQFQSFQYLDNLRLNGFRTIPPDPMGTASKSRLLAVVNVAIELRTKEGLLLAE